jgi:prepilin-type N-terminal cleavage/methylation domain-containing protein
MRRRGFTIVELLLAVSLLAVLLVTSGAVFKMAVKTHVTAAATAEISRKLRGITDQLDADFRGLRKDGIVFAIWVPAPVDKNGKVLATPTPGNVAGYKRFDRMLFFSDGDFYSYNQWQYMSTTGTPSLDIVRGNIARVCYMPAEAGNNVKAQSMEDRKRILARSQHILVKDPTLALRDFPDFANMPIPLQGLPNSVYIDNNNTREYDWATLTEWNQASLDQLAEMFTVAMDAKVKRSWAGEAIDPTEGGVEVNLQSDPPTNVHMLLCEGVGEFTIQVWGDPRGGPRWYPQTEFSGNGIIDAPADTDFNVTAGNLPDTNNLIYTFYHPSTGAFSTQFGRALKFTFTLYDSRGVFKEGKKFTHIVYLDD